MKALVFLLLTSLAAAEPIQTDLLIVGGTESGWAAAIQAARMGVKSITIVHDGEWLGGQYTEQGLVCVDENKGVGKVGWGPDWHPMKRDTSATLPEVIRMASLTPAELTGIAKHAGSLEKGKRADVLLLNRKLDVRRVFIRGVELT